VRVAGPAAARPSAACICDHHGGTLTAVPRPPRLTPDELADALQGLPLWSGDGDGLRRSVELPSFADAVAAVVRIGFAAEQLDHHPDVDLRCT
jgi:hypothetical protein